MAHVHSPGCPDHVLDVKPRAVVTCIRNLAPHMGVVNGSRLEVVRADRHVLLARQLYAPFALVPVAIPRHVFNVPVPKSDVCVSRRQFPIRVAYSCTCRASWAWTSAAPASPTASCTWGAAGLPPQPASPSW
jgi:hypothetical protein